jgi:CRP-like cAMP-binding protein
VITAENGKIGVDLAIRHHPDLIICDIMMPELDGYGVLYLLGKNSSTANIPFIFLSAKTEHRDIRKGMNLGADDYLTKPFDEIELLSAIESRLKKHDLFNREFDRDLKGLNEFIHSARTIRELQALSENYKPKSVRKKEMIYMEGDAVNDIIFIAKGKVKTFKTNEQGKDLVLNIFGNGEFLGFIDLFENVDHRESALAMEDSEIVFIPRQDFYTIVFNNRDVAAKFIKILSNNLAETEDRLLRLAYNSVRKRVADALVKIHKSSGETPSAGKIMISREDLAAMVGTATESVIRTLSDFRDENLIDIVGKEIKIVNPDKLIRMKN